MTWWTLIAELALALGRALGLAIATKANANERAAGAAQQRAEDYAHETQRIEKAAHAGLESLPGGLPDPFDRDRTG